MKQREEWLSEVVVVLTVSLSLQTVLTIFFLLPACLHSLLLRTIIHSPYFLISSFSSSLIVLLFELPTKQMEPQRPSNSDPKSASLILKQLKEAAKAAEDVDDYYDTDEEDEEDDDEEEIVDRFGFRVESNNDGKVVTKKKKLVASDGSAGKRGATGGGVVAPPCCQVEKCGADLTEAKRYYKRHKVCEAHAKSPLVVVDGIRQRFCQQCSRFQEVSEFDEMRRSCRSRLAGHNERRRKLSSETHHREDSSSSSSSRSQLKEIQRGQVDERGRITIAVPGRNHIQIR